MRTGLKAKNQVDTHLPIFTKSKMFTEYFKHLSSKEMKRHRRVEMQKFSFSWVLSALRTQNISANRTSV
jgi:hypothetical protein